MEELHKLYDALHTIIYLLKPACNTGGFFNLVP
jgi:hypothetical protein